MKYWWVNQGKTFEEARKLSVLWAPIFDKAGRKQATWDALDILNPGDVVFHYAEKKIRMISTVASRSRKASKRIRDKNKWGDDGREVEVIPQDFDFEIDLEDIPLGLRSPNNNDALSPFDKNGGVVQAYLFQLSDNLVQFVLQRLNLVSEQSTEPLERQVMELLGNFKEGTDKIVNGTVRLEQRALRQHLLGKREIAECGICGRSLISSLLVAAHIKPRNICSENERLDPNVVMLACALGCDALFEKGVIYVDSKGTIKFSTKHANVTALVEFTRDLKEKSAGAHSGDSKKYFDWHLKNVGQDPISNSHSER